MRKRDIQEERQRETFVFKEQVREGERRRGEGRDTGRGKRGEERKQEVER